MRASYLMSGVATGLRRNLSMTVALVLSTAISLAFLGGAFLMSKEITKFKDLYEDKINISIYLCNPSSHLEQGSPCKTAVTPAQKTALEAKLKADSTITSVGFITAQEATIRARQLLGKDIVDAAGPDPFPSSFTLKLKDVKTDYQPLVQKYSKEPGVDQIQNQDDSLKVLLNLFDSARQGALVVAALALVAAIILMSNTIQVAAQQRRNETGIMRLVGATRWMTQLPFIVEAMIAALVGGILAVGLVFAGKITMLDGVFGQQVSRGVLAKLDFNDVLVASGFPVLAGVVLAALTAWVTLRLYVKI